MLDNYCKDLDQNIIDVFKSLIKELFINDVDYYMFNYSLTYNSGYLYLKAKDTGNITYILNQSYQFNSYLLLRLSISDVLYKFQKLSSADFNFYLYTHLTKP